MKYKIVAFKAPHALVEFSTDDNAHAERLNVRIDKNIQGNIPAGAELDSYIMSFCPQLPRVDPFAGADWSHIESLVQPPPAPEPFVFPERTQQQLQDELVATVQHHLDSVAQSRGYDGIMSLSTYAASTKTKFAAEGAAGLAWRDSVWDYCWGVLADVQNGVRPIPTPQELVAELPQMTWPN